MHVKRYKCVSWLLNILFFGRIGLYICRGHRESDRTRINDRGLCAAGCMDTRAAYSLILQLIFFNRMYCTHPTLNSTMLFHWLL